MKYNYAPYLHYDISPGVGAVIGGGSSLLGDIFNLFGQSKANREQEAYNTSVMNQQRAWSLEDLANQNAYNSPVQQMARYREAGLNPNLIYGEGTAASSGASDQPRSVSSPSFNPSNPAASFANLGNQAMGAIDTANAISRTKADVSNTNQDTALKNAQTSFQGIKNIIENSDGRADSSMKELYRTLDFGNASSENEIKNNQRQASKVLAQRATQEIYLEFQGNDRANALNARQQALQAPTLAAALQLVQNMIEQNTGLRQQNLNLAADFNKIENSSYGQQLENQMKNGDLNKSDIQTILQPVVDLLFLRYMKGATTPASPGNYSQDSWKFKKY